MSLTILLSALIQSHVISHALCLPAIIDEHQLKTIGGEKLTLMCNESGTYVGDSRLSGEFIIGRNGIVHLIGDIIVPNRGLLDLCYEASYSFGTRLDDCKLLFP